MNQAEFLQKFIEQFEDTDASEITLDCKFRELDEWSSLVALGVIAFVRTSYGKALNATEMRSCETVEDLYNLVSSK